MQLTAATPTFTFSALPTVTAATTVPAAVPVPVATASSGSGNSVAVNTSTASSVSINNTSLGGGGGNGATNASATAADSFEERMNYFKIREAELRCKEQQLATEAKRIELNKAQDELKYMKEVHRLRVEELTMKIRILQKEEEQLRKCSTS